MWIVDEQELSLEPFYDEAEGHKEIAFSDLSSINKHILHSYEKEVRAAFETSSFIGSPSVNASFLRSFSEYNATHFILEGSYSDDELALAMCEDTELSLGLERMIIDARLRECAKRLAITRGTKTPNGKKKPNIDPLSLAMLARLDKFYKHLYGDNHCHFTPTCTPRITALPRSLDCKDEATDWLGKEIDKSPLASHNILDAKDSCNLEEQGSDIYTLGVANGTDALTIALKVLKAMGVKRVGLGLNGFIADFEAVNLAGLRYSFIDVDSEGSLEYKDSELDNLDALIITHLYGNATRRDEIIRDAKSRGLYIIEDLAQAAGAYFCTRVKELASYERLMPEHLQRDVNKELISPINTLDIMQSAKAKVALTPAFSADIATYSFYPAKNLGALGDGGALLTRDKEMYRAALKLANHTAYKNELGFNSRLDHLQAIALGLKLPSLDIINALRRAQAALYKKGIKNKKVRLPNHGGLSSIWHQFVVQVDSQEYFCKYLQVNGIKTRIHYKDPVGLYKHSNAMHLSEHIVSLPIGPHLSISDINYICKVINKY